MYVLCTFIKNIVPVNQQIISHEVVYIIWVENVNESVGLTFFNGYIHFKIDTEYIKLTQEAT